MARIGKGILDGVSGTVGNVVGASWKGIDYIRTKPDHVTNPNTPAQQKQRLKFKGVTGMARMLIDEIVHPIWDLCAVKMSGYNYFVKSNIGAYGDDGKLADPSKLVISEGALQLPLNISVSKNPEAPFTLVVKWDDNSDPESDRYKDKLQVFGIEPDGATLVLNNDLACRGDKEATFITDIPGDFNYYVFFASEDKKAYSPSRHNLVSVG